MHQGAEQPSEIDKAIELLIALKAARPPYFEKAMARLNSAASSLSEDDPTHASSLVVGLLKSSFSRESSRMLLDISSKLPRLPSGALALVSRQNGSPASLAARALRLHGLGSAWTRFFMQSIRDGLLPSDPDCAFDLVCRIEEVLDDPSEGAGWLGHPDSFHEALGAFFSWSVDWAALGAQAKFDFLPWILQHWLHEGSPASLASALRSCKSLLASGAVSGLTFASWLDFARVDHRDLAAESLEVLSECLRSCLPLIDAQGLSPCLLFCKLAYPTEFMEKALRLVIEIDPGGVKAVDAEGLSCLYWINARICQHESPHWQTPLLDCFSCLVDLGADPRLIAPQVALASMAKHPCIAAAVEAAEIAQNASQAASSGSRSL